MNCEHNKRVIFNTEDYLPAGIVQDVICKDCFQIVGTKYKNEDGQLIFVEGLEDNMEDIVPNRLIFPSFII